MGFVLTPDARFLTATKGVQGESARTVTWDLSTGMIRSVLLGHSDDVRAMAVTPDGRVLATGGGDETIKIWGLHLRSRAGHSPRALKFVPDGHTLVSAGYDGTIRVWYGDPADRYLR